MPEEGAIRGTYIQFTLRDNDIEGRLSAISGAGDVAVRTMERLDTGLNRMPASLTDNSRELRGLTETWDEYQTRTGGIISRIPSTSEKIASLSGSFAAFGHDINTVMNWLDRYEISQLNVESATNRLENAQMRYDEAVKKYGENSEETKKASNELQNAQNALDKANLRANSSMVLIGISALSMIPDFLKAGQALVTFATKGTIAIAGQTYTVNANTIAHAANSAVTWVASGAKAFLTTITSAATYKNIAHALSIGAVTAATWLWSAATWSVAIPLIAIEAPVWAIMLAIGGLILVIQDLYTWLTGGESVIGDFLGWLTSIDFSSVIETFKSAGKFLLDALLEGMSFGVLNTDRIASIFGTIRDFLPFSNAKVGPLSDLTTSGQRFIQTFSAGAESQQGYLSSILGGLFKLPEAAMGLVGSILPGVQTDTQQAPISQPLTGITSMFTGGMNTAPEAAAQGGGGIVVNVTVTGNTISGDEGSLKTLAGITASEFEKMLLKVLNQEAMRAGM